MPRRFTLLQVNTTRITRLFLEDIVVTLPCTACLPEECLRKFRFSLNSQPMVMGIPKKPNLYWKRLMVLSLGTTRITQTSLKPMENWMDVGFLLTETTPHVLQELA